MLAIVRFTNMSVSSILFLFVFLTSCSNTYKTADAVIDATKTTIKDRFIAPQGYTTIVSKSNSFGEYLQNLKLKPIEAKVTTERFNCITKFAFATSVGHQPGNPYKQNQD